MNIEIDDLSRHQVHALLQEHLDNMYELSPPEQVFALDLSKLRAPEITVWSIWDDQQLLGCGALKELSPSHGEIKSMRTANAERGKGAGRKLLQHIVSQARKRGYGVLSLETGSHPAFEPARSLYRSHGFSITGPFGTYLPNPHSVFMQMQIDGSAAYQINQTD